MLTTQEGGTAASAPKHAEDICVNNFGDGGAAMGALRCSQPGRRKQAAPLALVWFWWLEEDRTEETRQTIVLNNLNCNQQGHLRTKAECSMSTYIGSTVQSMPRTVLLCLQLTKGEAAKPQDKAQVPPHASTTF